MAGVGYICIGTNNFDQATAFYDALFGEIGGKRLFPTPHGLMYRVGEGPMVMITKPYDDKAATASNGGMLAFAVESKDRVAAMHAKAIALGGKCEGEPGPRGEWGEFAYFRDLDGNKLAVFHSPR